MTHRTREPRIAVRRQSEPVIVQRLASDVRGEEWTQFEGDGWVLAIRRPIKPTTSTSESEATQESDETMTGGH